MKPYLVNAYLDLAGSGMVMPYNEILHTWKYLYCKQLKNWGFNSSAADQLFAWGRRGHNWKKLWADEGNGDRISTDLLKDFLDELHYCGDRMDLDRLFRCHWLFNQYRQKFERSADKCSDTSTPNGSFT